MEFETAEIADRVDGGRGGWGQPRSRQSLREKPWKRGGGEALSILLFMCLAPVGRNMDNAIHWINHYTVDKCYQNKPRYPLYRDLFIYLFIYLFTTTYIHRKLQTIIDKILHEKNLKNFI